jgi:hypothetical protein
VSRRLAPARVERRHAGPVESEPSAGAREQREDHRVLGQNVLSKGQAGIGIQVKHRCVELQNILFRDLAALDVEVPTIPCK